MSNIVDEILNTRVHNVRCIASKVNPSPACTTRCGPAVCKSLREHYHLSHYHLSHCHQRPIYMHIHCCNGLWLSQNPSPYMSWLAFWCPEPVPRHWVFVLYFVTDCFHVCWRRQCLWHIMFAVMEDTLWFVWTCWDSGWDRLLLTSGRRRHGWLIVVLRICKEHS